MKSSRFEEASPKDESPFPAEQYQAPKEKYALTAGTAEVNPENNKEFDFHRCPYCGEGSPRGDWVTREDGAITEFSCGNGHKWDFVRDRKDGEILPTTGFVRGLSESPNGMTEEDHAET